MSDPNDPTLRPLALPSPQGQDAASGGASGNPQGAGRRKRRRRAASHLPTAEQIIAELNSLKGAVAAGWIKPAQANSMAKVYELMLKYLRSGGDRQRGSGGLEDVLADMARRDPEVLNVLEPYLTDEQFYDIVADLADDPPEQASEGPPPI